MSFKNRSLITRNPFSQLLALILAISLMTPLALQAQTPRAVKGPDVIADLAENLIDTVVNISTSQRVAGGKSVPMPQLPPGSPFQDFFEEFFNRRQGDRDLNNDGSARRPERRVSSLGSGFVIDASGIVITNNHVVESADEINVIFHDGTTLKAKLLGSDKKTDLAVLKVESTKPLAATKFGDSDRARIGEWVIAIGNPFGLGGSVSAGIISARNRDISSGPYDSFIQTDASINRGNSGGPLFNMDGEVIGINTAIISPGGGGGSVGIGFSVPSNIAQAVISQIREFGETRRGWLGVRITPVNDDIAESLGMPKARGALIAGITEDGAAAKAGIQPGDVVLKFNNREIAQMRDLSRFVADSPIDASVPVLILRAGKEETKQVKVGRLEEEDKKTASAEEGDDETLPGKDKPDVVKSKQLLGLSVAEITPELKRKYKLSSDMKGLLIVDVDRNSTAAEKLLKPGDLIVEVSQIAMKTPADFEKRIEALNKQGRKSALLLLANGKNELRFVTLPLGDK